MPDLTNPKVREAEAMKEEIGRIIRIPTGPKKWRASYNLWLKQATEVDGVMIANSVLARETAKSAKLIRETRANKFASSAQNIDGVVGGSQLRFGLHIPEGALIAIEAFHPELMKGQRNEESKNNFAKLCKEFTEFAIPEVV